MLKLHIKSLPETEVSQWEYIYIYMGLEPRTEGKTYQFDYCREKLHKNPCKGNQILWQFFPNQNKDDKNEGCHKVTHNALDHHLHDEWH